MEKNKVKNSSALRFISEVAGGKKGYIVVLLLVQVLLGVSSVFYALFLRNAIDGAVAHDRSAMVQALILLGSLVVGQIALRALIRYFEELAKSGYENAFKKRLFSEILYRDYEQITATHSAEWMNRLTSDTVVVAEGLATILPGIGGMLVKLLSALVMIVILEPRFGFLLIPGGLLLAILTYAFRKHLKQLHKQMQERDGAVRIHLQEQLSGLMVVKAFSKEERAIDETDERMEEHKRARLRKNYFSNLCNIGFGGVMQGAYVLGAVYGAVGIYYGTTSYGTMMAMLQLIGQIQGPFANITGYLPKYYAMIASAERLMEAEKLEKDRTENTVTGISKKDSECFGLSQVSFSYQGESETLPVLSEFNLEVKKGEFIAFTGPSGCGKSTVLKLLMGLYHPKQGEVYGVQREQCAYVPQGNQLMSGTIREVITFGEDAGERGEERLQKALEVACASEFVKELAQGVETELGERGCGLSEGQMQRIAIARAIYSGREILLLDESTSALDGETEKKVLENIRALTNQTVIIVTHRPQALQVCDRQIAFGG